jgi:hypothetical protein
MLCDHHTPLTACRKRKGLQRGLSAQLPVTMQRALKSGCAGRRCSSAHVVAASVRMRTAAHIALHATNTSSHIYRPPLLVCHAGGPGSSPRDPEDGCGGLFPLPEAFLRELGKWQVPFNSSMLYSRRLTVAHAAQRELVVRHEFLQGQCRACGL